MDIRLDGKTALITGGSEGLGLAMAHKFSQSGANVALLARDPDKLENAKQEIISSVKGISFNVAYLVPCPDQINLPIAPSLPSLTLHCVFE